MSIKTKLGLGIGAAALGLSLIGGGTFAYFNTTVSQASTFQSGTMNLAVNPTTLINLNDLAPGDYMTKTFNLQNKGSIDIKKILLHTAYSVTKRNGDTVDPATATAYAKAIRVDFLYNNGEPGSDDGNYKVLESKSLYDLAGMTPDNLATELEKSWDHWGRPTGYVPVTGLPANSTENTNNFSVKFTFVDDGTNQNALQDLKLGLTWQFEGTQRDGMDRSNN